MKLCLATMINLINNYRRKKTPICRALFLGIDPTYNAKVDNKISEYTSGERNAPINMDEIKNGVGLDDVADAYHNGLSLYVNVLDRKTLIERVLNVVANDIDDVRAITLYYDGKQMEWIDFLNLDFYDFDQFLAAMCRAAILHGQSKGDGDGEVGDALSAYRTKPVALKEECDTLIDLGTGWTLKDLDFHQYFNSVSGSQPNRIYQGGGKLSDLKFFYLSPDCGRFNREKLVDLLEAVTKSYVFSNSTIDSSTDEGRLAISAYRRIQEGSPDNGDELRDILSYVFSEKCIPAPKLLTAIQMETNTTAYLPSRGSNKIFHSRGIHVAAINPAEGGRKYLQYIFTISAIQDDLEKSIDYAIQTMGKMYSTSGLISDMTREQRFLDLTGGEFNVSEDIARDIKAAVLPSEGEKRVKEMGFSVFLGFKMDDAPSDADSMNAGEYEDYVIDTLRWHLEHKMEYIREKLRTAGITQSVYFYMLPFDDPIKDKKDIMDDFLGRRRDANA